MKNSLLAIVLTALVSLSLTSCATTPTVHSWRPWTRTFAPLGPLPEPGTSLTIQVTGETGPALGTDEFLNRALAEQVEGLLKRRGYEIGDSVAQNVISVSYMTREQATLDISSYSSSSGFSGVSGYGVYAASNVYAANRSSTHIDSDVAFVHTIALELQTTNEQPIWKGEAVWSTTGLDITMGSRIAFQLLLANLPSDPSSLHSVPRVRASHEENYYRLNLENQGLSCPALPFRIQFHGNTDKWRRGKKRIFEIKGVKDGYALAAFRDLAQTAELAVPRDADKASDLLERSVWSTVILGGYYRISDVPNPVPILMELNGSERGYSVEKAWVASDAEFQAFEESRSRWLARLEEYYSVFAE